ncbi:hypothetical protein ACFOYW_13350 [Gryllotalpicola reticulitermitis]|uniref:Uncharacterized protein n=1 Tax=Gryllotalpicola reticulitermitis TaxID=1184153 RepID=A0ABV8Q7R8_9MICO
MIVFPTSRSEFLHNFIAEALRSGESPFDAAMMAADAWGEANA